MDIAEFQAQDWEEYYDDTTNNLVILRFKVPGGWLVNVEDTDNSMSDTLFISDPGWNWISE